MNENTFNTIAFVVACLVMGMLTEWRVAFLFLMVVGVYAVAVVITSMVQQRTNARARSEQAVFEARLHSLIRNDRQALPVQAWFDAK